MHISCALKLNEVLLLVKNDFDLGNRILTVQNVKNPNSKKQYTTIMPYDVNWRLERFLTKFSENERLFPTTHSTISHYYKNSGIIAGMNLLTFKNTQKIIGV